MSFSVDTFAIMTANFEIYVMVMPLILHDLLKEAIHMATTDMFARFIQTVAYQWMSFMNELDCISVKNAIPHDSTFRMRSRKIII